MKGIALPLVAIVTSTVFGLSAQTGSVAPRRAAVRVVESVDLARYAGQWFEIARLPNKAQSVCVADVTARYALRRDGRIDVINACRTAAGTVSETYGLARKANTSASASDARLQLRVGSAVRSIFGGGWTDYWILGIGPDYTWAVAGSPNRDRLWILARSPEMSASSYERAITIASGNGFDVSRLVRTPHKFR